MQRASRVPADLRARHGHGWAAYDNFWQNYLAVTRLLLVSTGVKPKSRTEKIVEALILVVAKMPPKKQDKPSSSSKSKDDKVCLL